MRLLDIKNVKFIIKESYSHDGVFLKDLWMDICNSNLDFELPKTFEALILILRFLIENDIAQLIGYDEEEKKEIFWEGDGEDELNNLENYLTQFSEKKIKKNPAFLYQFKYPSYKWKIAYPVDLKKYGLES